MEFIWCYEPRVILASFGCYRDMPRTSANDIAVAIMQSLDIHIEVSSGGHVRRNEHEYSPKERSGTVRQRVKGGQAVDDVDETSECHQVDQKTHSNRFEEISR